MRSPGAAVKPVFRRSEGLVAGRQNEQSNRVENGLMKYRLRRLRSGVQGGTARPALIVVGVRVSPVFVAVMRFMGSAGLRHAAGAFVRNGNGGAGAQTP